MGRLRDLAERAAVADLAARFAAAGHELALVGGTVRDAFLGRGLSGDEIDLDFTTSARPDDTERVLASLGARFGTRAAASGTIGVRLGGYVCEITTYRSDSYDGTTRKPDVEFGDSLEADLERRDFTLNAMALRIPDLRLVDPTGGFDDLLARRCAHPPPPRDLVRRRSPADDARRALRAQIGFDLDTEALAAAQRMARRSRSSRPSGAAGAREAAPRARSVGRHPAARRLRARRARPPPRVPALRLEIDEHARHKDVYEHSLTALDQRSRSRRAGPRARPRAAPRRAAARHRQARDAPDRVRRGRHLPPPRRPGGRLAIKRLKALRSTRTRRSGSPTSSSFTCGSSATPTARGPTRGAPVCERRRG